MPKRDVTYNIYKHDLLNIYKFGYAIICSKSVTVLTAREYRQILKILFFYSYDEARSNPIGTLNETNYRLGREDFSPTLIRLYLNKN